MEITIREDGSYVYADVTGGTPREELFIELRSKAIAPNDSTSGATCGLHKTVAVDGTCHFKVIRSALLMDTSEPDGNLPREITAVGPIASEVFTT